MEFSQRSKQIIILLLNEDKPVSTKYLAENINVSKRTVQRELEYITYDIKRYNLKLSSKTGLGIWIDGSEEDKKELLNKLNENQEIDTTNKEERKKKLILELLKDRSPKKIYYYANMFKVSEATIRNDLDEVEEWMNQLNLSIIRKQGYGIYLEGSEENYRNAVKKCIDENLNVNNLNDIFKQNKMMTFKALQNENNICGLFDNEILTKVLSCLQSIEHKKIIMMTEDSYVGLVLHITIAIERCIKNETIESNDELLEKLKKDENYNLAKYIIAALEEEFKIKIPDIEIAYVCLHIKAAKLQYTNENISKEEEEEKKDILNLVNEMINSFDSKISFELKEDEEFIKGLITHLQPTIVRLTNKMFISNPLLEQIKSKYADIYEKSIQASKVLEKRLNVSVPEDEIGFLALHFGAALVRLNDKKETKRKVKIGVVCASGIGISRLMSVRIDKIFKGKVDLITLAKEDITDKILKKVDFIVTSLDLGNIKADVVNVNPFLLDNDLEKINEKIREYSVKSVEVIDEKTDFSSELTNVSIVAEKINTIIKKFKCIEFDENISFSELVKYIGTYIAEIENSNKEEQKEISENIKERITKREELMTQIMPEFGFALLHSRCEKIKEPHFMVGITDKKGSFKDEYFKDIKVVVIMLIPIDENIKINVDISGVLSSKLVEDRSFLDLIETGEEEKIRAFISKILRKYFNNYLKDIYND